MNKTIRALSVLAMATVIAVIISSNSTRSEVFAGDDGTVPQEYIPTTPNQNPVLAYDVSGYTLTGGFIHFRMTVYDTGHVSLSAAGYDQVAPQGAQGTEDPCPQDGKAVFGSVTPQEAKQLHTDLVAAGAFRADNGLLAVDLPISTVTVFTWNNPNARSHTFTFHFANSPQIEETMNVINAFIDEHFPDF